MASKIDAVIAALRTELQQAERSRATWVKSHRCNRWIRQLPGGWLRWRNLLIIGDSAGEVSGSNFITHVKATLAYLESIRHEVEDRPSLWRSLFTRRRKVQDTSVSEPTEPIDAEFTDIQPSGPRKLPKPKVVK